MDNRQDQETATVLPASSHPKPRDRRSSLWRRLGALKRYIGALWGERYDPAKHYMRGPGPKTLKRRDHGSEGAP
jgi:hypothetical protein